MRLGSAWQIAFIGNLPPIVLRKTPYWQRPELEGTFHPNPYFDGKTSGIELSDRLGALWGRIYLALVWWMAPHPLAACIIASPFLWFAWHFFRGVMQAWN